MHPESVSILFEDQELEGIKHQLLKQLDRWTTTCGAHLTKIPHLIFFRQIEPQGIHSYVMEPSLCYIVQGAKQIIQGKTRLIYDAHRFLITAMDLPVFGEILEASKEKPYLSLTLKLEYRYITELMMENHIPPPAQTATPMITVSKVQKPLLTSLLRLINLLDEPEHISVLAPLIEREIVYRLLVSEQGTYLRQTAMAGHQGYRVFRAIQWLKQNFSQKFKVEELASHCHMSLSSFHQHFRKLTGMSPLQYQKFLRLHEARRLMFMEHYDAASAAYKVGYESPSQFNREYKRLFKVTPTKDIKELLKENCVNPAEAPY